MKILITGTRGLAKSIADIYADHDVTAVSITTGHDVHAVDEWGKEFIHYDMVINCAYSSLGQIKILEFFSSHWHHDKDKKIVTIGSTACDYPGARPDMSGMPWPYRFYKRTLLHAWQETCHQQMCSKIINPGPIDTPMTQNRSVTKMPPDQLAKLLRDLIDDPWIRRVDLWP